jgi:DNA-directed RNA polymerase subunit M/transcription elongation factor TFIIS
MQTLDPAGAWLRLAEHYRQLSDGELVRLARQTSELTDVAQQVLGQEIANRRLKVPPEEPAAPRSPALQPNSAAEAESPYAEDRELVLIGTVWSLADALQLQGLLDKAGIPFYMGPEKATRVEAGTPNFAKGLSVQIMQVGLPWARRALRQYFPADEPPQERMDESDRFAIHCPKCHSTEVVFEDLDRGPQGADGKPSSKFKWTCDSCGHEWEDDGLLTEG